MRATPLILAVLAAATLQAPGTETPLRFLNPPGLATPTGYTHVVETTGRRTVYLAGQVALDAAGNVVGKGDVRAQAEQVFRNLELALKSAGLGVEHVAKMTTYLVDPAGVAAVREVRARYFAGRQPPAHTLVRVAGLAREEFLLEVEAIAVAR